MFTIRPMVGVLLVAHGSTVDAESARGVREVAHALRAEDRFDEVRCAFWREQGTARGALARTASQHLVVVPMLMAEGFFAREVLPVELGLRGALNQRGGRFIRMARPVGAQAAMDRALDDLISHTLAEGESSATALVILGHGTTRSAESGETVWRQVGRLRALGRFESVEAAFLEQTPSLGEALSRGAGERALVVPYLLGGGPHLSVDLPASLGLAPSTPDARCSGLVGEVEVTITRPLGRWRGLSEVVAASAQEALDAPWSETLEGDADAWLDGWTPDAVERARDEMWRELMDREVLEIGELLVTFDVMGRVELRHLAERATEGLEATTLPLLDPRLAIDPQGAYRPLRSAVGLPKGWRLEVTSMEALVDALETIYPNVLASRWGEPRPTTDWEHTALRQRGRLNELQLLPRDYLEALATQVCEGHGCLKYPAWLRGELRSDLGLSGGLGGCSEACGLFQAAAITAYSL